MGKDNENSAKRSQIDGKDVVVKLVDGEFTIPWSILQRIPSDSALFKTMTMTNGIGEKQRGADLSFPMTVDNFKAVVEYMDRNFQPPILREEKNALSLKEAIEKLEIRPDSDLNLKLAIEETHELFLSESRAADECIKAFALAAAIQIRNIASSIGYLAFDSRLNNTDLFIVFEEDFSSFHVEVGVEVGPYKRFNNEEHRWIGGAIEGHDGKPLLKQIRTAVEALGMKNDFAMNLEKNEPYKNWTLSF